MEKPITEKPIIEKRVELGMLLDFYGPLLSERRREVMQMYFGEDMSLQEIADTLGISRQAVHDLEKSASLQLYKHEEALGLLQRYRRFEQEIQKCTDLVKQVRGADEDDRQTLKEIKSTLERIDLLETE